MKEEWKDIKGYEGKYQVSNLGRVKTLDYHQTGKEQIMKLKWHKRYYYIKLSKNGIGYQYLVHRLVAETFLNNPDNLPYINHIDHNPKNNNVTNLEWCTQKYNVRHGRAKKVGCYKDNNLIKVYDTLTDAEYDGFVRKLVRKCCNGLSSQHKGYQWEWCSE